MSVSNQFISQSLGAVPCMPAWGVSQGMNAQTQAYFLALTSSLCFSVASLIFADLARKISPLWMNAFKALVAWFCFLLALWLGGHWAPLQGSVVLALFASGILGLAIGDIFLLTAYARMGSARTLILFGFQPLFIGIAAHIFFNQEMTWLRATAVLFFIACLFVFSLEKFRQYGHWELFGLGAALLGVLLDNCGVMLSRWSFDVVPTMDALQVNLIRCSGALLFFMIFGSVRRVHLLAGWQRLGRADRWLAVFAAFMGTFFSLFLYLTAVKIGHLASISALGGAAPILSSGFECIYQKKAPTKYLVAALALFLCGFTILTLS